MTIKQQSIFDCVQNKLHQLADNEILAKSSVSIASTLESLNWKDDRDMHYEPKLSISKKDKKTLVRLSVLSYYVPKELRYYLRMTLQDIVSQRIELSDVRFILTSERNMKCWLRDLCETHSGNQIFGNFFDKNEWTQAFKSIKIKKARNHKRSSDSLPEKRTIGVGYRDKGTLPNSTSPGSLKDLSLTQLQNSIEDGRQAADDLTKILEGFFW